MSYEHCPLEAQRVEDGQKVTDVYVDPVGTGEKAAATTTADVGRDQRRAIPKRPRDRQP
jgi:hypothetical protein